MAERQSAARLGPARAGSRSARKRSAIVDAATSVFLRSGYVGASMDEVAARAGVSKQTVYRHFADKERLFTDIVLATIDQVGAPFYEDLPALRDTDDLERDLRKLARRLVAIVMQPGVLQLRRLVTAEAGRFPGLGRAYYERGPGRTAESLAAAFAELAERGLLDLEEPRLAAQHFIWLSVSIPLNEAMLTGEDERYSAAELARFADAGVRAFYAGHRPASPPAPRRKAPRSQARKR